MLRFGVIVVIMIMLIGPVASQMAPTAQEQIERTIGSLVVQNATLTEQVQRLQAELAKERAKNAPAASSPN